jgi:hypothetical protein
MGTWHLPGGHRITDVPEIPEDFTPTAEEWFWSAVLPPNFLQMYSDKSGETTMYFGLNTSAAAFALWRTAGNSLSAYRMMSAAHFAASAPGVMLALAVAGTVTQADVAANHGAGTRGSLGSISPSYHLVDDKPWWEDFSWPWS